MTCTSRAEREAAAKRKIEIEALKTQRKQEEAAAREDGDGVLL